MLGAPGREHQDDVEPVACDASREVGALAIFQGPGTYISPSWYPTKQETGKVVPTWNYAIVHAHGPLRVIEDRHWLRELVERLTNRHEAGRRDPWKVTDAPADFIDQQLGAIGRPARVHFVTLLPKTRSGKVLRRSIQAICEGRDPGDLTTIEDQSALQQVRDAMKAKHT